MTDPSDFAPDFFVVGAPKAGTTAVYRWLCGHPDVFLPAVKEPGYFAYAGRSTRPVRGPFDPDYIGRITVDNAAYAALYAEARGRVTGDVSPVYLVDENAANRIAACRPDARIIVLLRDPVDRAFSQFMHHVRDGLEPCQTFEDALEAEDARLRDGWSWGHGYASCGLYAAQIACYRAAFRPEQILFLDFSRLQSDPVGCWEKICVHLGLARLPLTENAQVNTTFDLSRVPARAGLARAIRHPGRVQASLKRLVSAGMRARIRSLLEGPGRPVPTLDQQSRDRLAARFRIERPEVEHLSGLSLAHWR